MIGTLFRSIVMQVVRWDKVRCGILQMPVEILTEIAAYLPIPLGDCRWNFTSLVRLAQVSKLFSEICYKLLYHEVCIRVPNETGPLTTLVQQVSRLQIVRTFYVEVYDIDLLIDRRFQMLTFLKNDRTVQNEDLHPGLRSSLQLTRSALLQMTGLTSLHLRIGPNFSEPNYEGVFLPNLKRLFLDLFLTEEVYTFLNRHRKTIRFLWTSYVEHPSPNQPIGPFPQLSTCYASIHLLPIILPGSLVNEIGISFVDDLYPDMQLRCMDDLPITTVSFEVWEGTAGSVIACLSRMTSVEEACIELDCESNSIVVVCLWCIKL